MRGLSLVAPLLALAAGALAFAPRAGAIDTLRKRITVDFGAVPCMTRIDRSVDPVVELSWSIDEEESYPIPDDEVVGGRTHQLLAIARQDAGALPTWVSQTDIDATAAVVTDFGTPPPEDIWTQAPAWPSDSWTRVTPDDPRIEITFEAAAMGASWDTTGIPEGAWQLIGYTYDPPVNVSSRREGLFKVVDDDGDGPPALFIEPKDVALTMEGRDLELDACIDAAAGSSLSAYIGEVVGGGAEIEWEQVELSLDELPARGDFPFAVQIPWGAGGQPLRAYRVRLDVEDPSGAVYTAYSPRVYQVSEDPDGPPPDDESGASPCACRADTKGTPAASLALLALLAWRRRRAG